MKRYLAAALALTLALTLAACAASAVEDAPEKGSALGAASSAARADAGAQELFSAILPEEGSQPEGTGHSHQPAQADNILPHDAAGYCGNTTTTVSFQSPDESWEVSFWGGDSVELTDLLRYLDYSGDMCKCLPEYSVKTEFSEEPYGVSLTEGYARNGSGQAELTGEQVELIRGILDRERPN